MYKQLKRKAMKIEIKSIFGSVLFEYDCENNTMLKTLIKALESDANLIDAELSDADLSDASLIGANLSDASLIGADLSDASLIGANLSGANLIGADLRGAYLDYSCLHFSCKSRKPKTDERQRIQLAHHFLSWIKYSDNATDEEKQIFEQLKSYANRFHRTDVEKF